MKAQPLLACVLLLSSACSKPPEASPIPSPSLMSTQAAVMEAEKLCKSSLESAAIQATTFGVSMFRRERAYPPLLSEGKAAGPNVRESVSKLKEIPLAAECMQGAASMFTFKRYADGGGLRTGTNDDLKTVAVRKIDDEYFVVFMYEGFFEGDGRGDEMAASLAIYDSTGRLKGTIGRVSSWRNYESTVILLDACIGTDNITMTESVIDPIIEDEYGGPLLGYEAPQVNVERVYLKQEGRFVSGDLSAARRCAESDY